MKRRALLQLACCSVAAALPLAGCSTSGSRREANFSNPELLLEAYQRLSGSLDDRLIIWWMSGTRYGVVDARSTALYNMEVGMFHRWYRQPDGSFKAAFFELTYYSDPGSGTLLREFRNPYTGEINTVRHVRLGPEIRHLTVEGLATEANPMIREFRSSMGPAMVSGDRLWIPNSVEATIGFPKAGAPEILINIYTTVQGSLTDALNSKLVSAPCTFQFHNVLKWEPWMQMGAHPGHMMSIAAGRKLESVDQLPPAYLAMAEEVHGKYIADPLAALEKYAARLR
jgi:hypothetical protein